MLHGHVLHLPAGSHVFPCWLVGRVVGGANSHGTGGSHGPLPVLACSRVLPVSGWVWLVCGGKWVGPTWVGVASECAVANGWGPTLVGVSSECAVANGWGPTLVGVASARWRLGGVRHGWCG